MKQYPFILATALTLSACVTPMALNDKKTASEESLVTNFIETQFKDGLRTIRGAPDCDVKVVWSDGDKQQAGWTVLERLEGRKRLLIPKNESDLVSMFKPPKACTLNYTISEAPAVRKYVTTIWAREEGGQRLASTLTNTESEIVLAALKECKEWDSRLESNMHGYNARNASFQGNSSQMMAEAWRSTSAAAESTRPLLPFVLVCRSVKRDSQRYQNDILKWLDDRHVGMSPSTLERYFQ